MSGMAGSRLVIGGSGPMIGDVGTEEYCKSMREEHGKTCQI